MKRNKIIITINDIKDIPRLKKLGITHYAYPLDKFCVGMPNTFLSEEIPKDGYVFINRILDNESIDELEEIFSKNDFQGIIFDDLGILELIKDKPLEKILYLSHFNANSKSIQIYLEYVDSVIVATDITKKEIDDIVKCFPDKLTIFTLGYVGAMYSRRLLINNYCEFYHLEKKNPLVINNTNHEFLVCENPYGTYFYHLPLFNGLELLSMDAKYYFINSAFLSIQDIEELLEGKSTLPYDTNFLFKETIYKLKGDEK